MPAGSKIYALFVGINKYFDAPLSGCVNDAKYAYEFHKLQYGDRLECKLLLDEAASYDQLIKAFSIFKKAENGDNCLFFFAGHGSSLEAPPEFDHRSTGNKLETLVCFSENPQTRRDLTDKELSYLICEATKDKDVRFTVITDACHSAGMMRETELYVNDALQYRFLRNREDQDFIIPIEDFYGIEHYDLDGNFRTPPIGRFIHLSAAGEDQLASERVISMDGIKARRGLFTFSLFKMLGIRQKSLTYLELMNRVGLHLSNLNRHQDPTLQVGQPMDKALPYLGRSVDDTSPPIPHIVSWDNPLGAWTINTSSFQELGIIGINPTKCRLLDDPSREYEIKEIHPNYAVLADGDGLKEAEQYRVTLIYPDKKSKTLAFAPDSDPIGIDILTTTSQQYKSDLFSLSSGDTPPDFYIHARDNAYFLTGVEFPIVDSPLSRTEFSPALFKRSQGFSPDAAQEFLGHCDQLIRWHNLMALKNTGANLLSPDAYSIHLYQIEDPNQYDSSNPAKEEVDWENPSVFHYHQHPNAQGEKYPALQLKIVNRSNTNLYASVLYCMSDYGIDNQFMQGSMIPPQGEAWMLEQSAGGIEYRTIRIGIDEHYIANGIFFINDYLKILLSTDPIESHQLIQESLPLDLQHRGVIRRDPTPTSKWTAELIRLSIFDGPGVPS